jgi:hypothetical protein
VSANKVGLHAGSPCHGCTGIGDYWRALDAAGVKFPVYSVEGGGLIAEAAHFAHADPLIYRTLATDVATYEMTPDGAAARAWGILMDKLPPEVKALKSRVWIEIGNEQDKTRADWLGWYYVALAGHAAAGGYRICGPAWSTGEPEPPDWETPGILAYLRLCAAHPERLAVTTHEYSLDADDIMAGYPWLVGRVKFLFETCARHGIAPPVVFVTEAGWVHNDLPQADKAKQDIAALAELYAGYPTVKAAFLWTLIGGGDKKTLAAELNALLPWMTNFALTTTFPEPDTPPPVDPPNLPPDKPTEPIPMSNQHLINPSFEEEWTDAKAFPGHIPAGWMVEYLYGDAYPNPYGQPYKNGEAVKKHKGMLPPDEQDVFVFDGEWTYKIFGGGTKSFWFCMSQTVNLPAGRYLLTVPVWVDHYHWKGYKDYNVDPKQAQLAVRLNGDDGQFIDLESGRKHEYHVDFNAPGGAVTIDIHLRSNWDINGNFWLDGLSLTAVTEDEPDPPTPPAEKHRAIAVLGPQTATLEEWLSMAKYSYEFRHTMMLSLDDAKTVIAGGNDTSYIKLAYPTKQPDVAAYLTANGYTWIPILDAPTPPSVADTFRSPVGTVEERERGDLWD